MKDAVRKDMKKKINLMKNDSGFTLVEILIAMAILALVIVPLMNLFVSSMQLNMTSKRRMNATVLGEDVMEAVKNNTIEELAYKFGYPNVDIIVETDADGNPTKTAKNFNLIDVDMLEGLNSDCMAQLYPTDGLEVPQAFEIIEPNTEHANIKSENGGVSYTFDEEGNAVSADGKYYFCIKGMEIQKNKEKYDALVCIDAAPYRAVAGATVAPGDHKYNSQPVVDVETVGDENNAAFPMRDMDDDALSVLKLKDPTLTEDGLYRTITMDIMSVGDSTKVTLTFNYTGKTAAATNTYVPEPETIFNETENELKNVFLFFNPIYASRSGDMHDEIFINNKNDLPVNVYLVKQETIPSTSLQVAEALYKMNVAVKEGSSKEKPSTQIFTNLDKNLAAAYSDTFDADVDQVTYSYNGIKGSVAKNKLHHDLTNTKTEDRYFDVTVRIYKSSDVTGYNFPDSKGKIVYEINGSTQE